jgi:hypothetical protein
MKALVGKHKEKEMGLVLLKDPGYIKWLLEAPGLNGALVVMREESERLIKEFDAKPYENTCSGPGCTAAATQISLHRDSPAPTFWCAACDSYSSGARAGTLRIVGGYREALAHVHRCCGGSNPAYRSLVRYMAEGKGLKRAGAAQVASLFGAVH